MGWTEGQISRKKVKKDLYLMRFFSRFSRFLRFISRILIIFSRLLRFLRLFKIFEISEIFEIFFEDFWDFWDFFEDFWDFFYHFIVHRWDSMNCLLSAVYLQRRLIITYDPWGRYSRLLTSKGNRIIIYFIWWILDPLTKFLEKLGRWVVMENVGRL